MSGSRWSVVKSRISDLVARYRLLQTENADLIARINALQSKNEELVQHADALEVQVKELTSKKEESEAQIDALKLENGELSKYVDAFQAQVSELVNKIEAQKSNGISGQDLHLLQTQMARKDMMLESLENEKQNAVNRVRELEEMLLLKDSTLQVQKNTINELTEQNKLIKLAKEMSTEKADTHELKIKINELIRDIDRCIDLLND